MKDSKLARRDFVKAATAVALSFPTILVANQPKTLRLALIGCGGRGRGAMRDAHEAAKILGIEVKAVAFGDWFRERALSVGKEYGVEPSRCFGGPTAYREVLETEADIVLIATAPAFHSVFVEAAIKAGKHLFVEKPIAVDPVGCRRAIAAGKEAEQKGLVAVVGTQRRHDWNYRLTHQAVVVEGALGRLYAGRVAWCGGHAFASKPINPKTPDDLIRTWQNWVCLSGDHIVEQHIHNIDVANWFVGRPPISAVGFGFRARRPAGDQYDFFSVDFDYGDGIHIHSMCRQISGCWNWVGEEFVFEKGRISGAGFPKPKESPIPPDLPRAQSPYVQEHVDLLYYVLKGKPVNELQALAESTATAIMGRISAYTGRMVTWTEIMVDPNKNPALYNLQLKPTPEDFERGTVDIPQENVVPIPGIEAK
ncbi:MAG: hypothetical protein RUDDFDWM_001358 [Candidatus Fervidibacterota bacterium]